MSVNSRQKGKRIERFFATLLRPLFPDIRRNAGIQAQSGGVDLECTNPFNMEVKGGKYADIKKVQDWIDQVKKEGDPLNWDVILVKPDRKEPYIIMPYADWYEMLLAMKGEKII